MILPKHPPLYVSAGAAYPYSVALEERASMESRYGETFQLGRRNLADNTLWLPRALCPTAREDRRSDGEVVKYDHKFIPRNDEQGRVSVEGRRLLQAGHSFILQAPTGWGKTVVGCSLIAAPQRVTAVITTKEDILKQWSDAAKMVLGLSEDEICLWHGDNYPTASHKIAIALVQSVMKGPERYPEVDFDRFGLLVCDEVHRMGADQFSQSMWWFNAKLRLGLSATPYRKDGKERVFFGHIGPVEVTATQETLVPRIIVRTSDWKVPRVPRRDSFGDIEYVRLPHEPGKLGHINKILGQYAPRNRMIADFVRAAYKKSRNTVVFSDSLDHLDRMRNAIVAAGVPESDIGYYVGITGGSKKRSGAYTGSKAERQKQREQAKAKSVVLATYQMASEATDVPWWDTCVLAIPRSDVVQIVGRIRREYPGKTIPLVLDIVDRDSPVYTAFASKRMRWYQSLQCDVRVKH
jgi:superfamily II DNA or RNA helicase